MDPVFKALADPTRRALLDALFAENGRTLQALSAGAGMTRHGVMKHLRLLEDAGLVVTRRRGREKLHFLNPVPIRQIQDLWVSKYTAPWAGLLADLKTHLEDRRMERLYEIYIKTTPQRLWDALTDPQQRAKYNFGASLATDWTPGSPYVMSAHAGTVALGEGTNVEIDPPRRLVQTMTALWSEAVRAEGSTRLTWEIGPVGEACLLRLTHAQLREDANPELYGGWPMILSGLKTWLETGELLTTPGSLQHAR